MASKSAQDLGIDENLVDEIVEEILNEMSTRGSKTQPTAKEQKSLAESLPKDTSNLSARVKTLEEALKKLANSYSITAVEIERQITENYEEFNKEQEKQLLYLQDQIDTFRTALIRLSNEFKKFKESVPPQK